MLRVGSVPYLVGRPLDEGLEHEPGIELTREVPARLVAGLRDGSLDVALVSSIELFRRPGYSYLDGPAVLGRGFVSSVQVFLRRPLADVRRVALDPASRTAATLVRTVWPAARDHAPGPEFIELDSGGDPRLDVTADAWLRIGDPALHELWEPGAPPVFNPSAAWTAKTGLPFVFALWIARPGIELAPLARAFSRAARHGREHLAAFAEAEAEASGLPASKLLAYLRDECVYEPDGSLAPALLAFRDAAAALDLARGDLAPAAIPVPGTQFPR